MLSTENNYRITSKYAKALRDKYPSKLPVIIEKVQSNIDIEKRKFLVTQDFLMGQFMHILRKYIKDVNSSEAIYIFINPKSHLAPSSMTMGKIYDQHQQDSCLYLTIAKENTFG